MGLEYYASSPTVVLPPQQPTNYFDHLHTAQSPSQSPSWAGYKYPKPPSMNYLAAASNSAAGRKRSIDDTDPEDRAPDGATIEPPKPKAEPIYGPGMTLIYPDDPGFSIAAESQTGTWAEDRNTEKEAIAKRPIAISRKSQRRDSQICPTQASPVIDDKGNTLETLMSYLGVGWKSMADPILEAAARGYAKYIERHYALANVVVMLQCDSLSAYLVRAQEGGCVESYWLFEESLNRGQLVSSTLQGTANNLRNKSNIVFEGPQIQAIAQSPSPPPQAVADIDMDAAISVALPQEDVMQI